MMNSDDIEIKIETYVDWPWQKKLKVWFGSRLLALVTRGLLWSYRYTILGSENRKAAEQLHPKKSFCLVVWHEHLFATTLAHAFQPFAPLASPSADGAVVSYVMKKLGLETIRGSSSRGGLAARKMLIQRTQLGVLTAITVDGPRGPRRVVKGGAIDLARKTGVAIVPAVALSRSPWVLRKTWDQFKIPKPFSKIVLFYGPPIQIPSETQGDDFFKMMEEVKEAINFTEKQALEALEMRRCQPPAPEGAGL